MDIQTVASRTGLSLRKLRYVLDHRLLPGLRVMSDADRVGHPRTFTDLEGFGLACAASLLEGGVKREMVLSFMDWAAEYTWKYHERLKRPIRAIEEAFQSTGDASAMVGDAVNFRLKIGSRDTQWLQPRTWARLTGFEPRVVIQLDLGRLREQLKGEKPAGPGLRRP